LKCVAVPKTSHRESPRGIATKWRNAYYFNANQFEGVLRFEMNDAPIAKCRDRFFVLLFVAVMIRERLRIASAILARMRGGASPQSERRAHCGRQTQIVSAAHTLPSC